METRVYASFCVFDFFRALCILKSVWHFFHHVSLLMFRSHGFSHYYSFFRYGLFRHVTFRRLQWISI